MSQQQAGKATVKIADGKTLVFSGSLTRHSVTSLWQQRKDWPVEKDIQVDLTDVDVIDTAGVAFLLEIMKSIGNGQEPLVCLGASKQLKQIAHVSGVESLLSLS
ncbi:lipid asymmetry maintenance protein MlaB [Idiomarina sp. HP20-50]|uniref:STAS domain-containing protein n=1 Tax=Idiomarina sp. HP20-50 TaxID=3070813 RepID=UPI00294AD652|nr:STAS domain-containing protein [Idiomarina sp. HP20-50]MDV6315979.1 STAS domain-containing protein [Idiomarina sp. HP20-50]